MKHRMTVNSHLLQRLQGVLGQDRPRLPQEELEPFVEYFLSRKNEFLHMLEKNPSPLYILEPSVLRERATRFRRVFSLLLPDTSYYFAVKSNNHPDVARTVIESGFGLDVSSGLELEMALSLGSRDLVFSGPGKTEAELRLAVRHGNRVLVLVDSFNELFCLQHIADRKGQLVRIGVRLTTNPDGLWRKFGILPEELARFLDATDTCPNLIFKGLQFHTSWNRTPKAQIDFITSLGKMMRGLPKRSLERVQFIDIGGGFWPEQGEWLQPAGTAQGNLLKSLDIDQDPGMIHYRLPALNLESFAQQLSEAIHEHILSIAPCRICFEPGRWICNDAMHILISVVDIKGKDIVITDGGTNAVGWERFENDYFPVLNLSRPMLRERPCAVLGSLCTPHDIWGYGYWGEDIQIGDVLMIPTQGAYTYSLRQNFIKPLPEVVLLERRERVGALSLPQGKVDPVLHMPRENQYSQDFCLK